MATKTNETTQSILKFLFSARVFAWRSNVLPIPLAGGGFRPGSKSGVPDIIGVLPTAGRFLGVEIKTGYDKLRPEQIGFHETARKMGALILVVKDYADFLVQWNEYLNELELSKQQQLL